MPIHCPNFPRKYQNIPRKQYQQPHRRHDVCISHASSAPSSSKLLSLVLLTPFFFFLFLPSLTLNYLRKLTNRREVNSDCSTVQLAQCSPSTHVSVRRILAPRVANPPCCSHTSVHLLLLLWNPCDRQKQNGLEKDGWFFFFTEWPFHFPWDFLGLHCLLALFHFHSKIFPKWKFQVLP